ncbi:MAG TPA: cysteine desulfurase [Candidatus Borkfalkia faecipullorum]|uniref:Cysteine desulfurase n=1 Tax=Candidatus Borkfalkia faecipullorum TaxID=2838510 RepID=A0A9D2AG73_9FIRM|nr:cysteine desulfurase [Candidatus Borkfalkia faecipullorum]
MIYLDNAATTVPDEGAVNAALQFLKIDGFYNPSALYRAGFAAHKEIEEARRTILSLIAPQGGYELVFTGSGSEADNQAVFSSARRGNFVTTAGEHAAIYQSAKELEKRGIEVRFAPLRSDGSADTEALLSMVDKDTSCVSAIHVNNETGAVNDIAAIAAAAKKINPALLFHSDGVQAFGKIPFALTKDIDLYTVSAHKIGGVRGVAGLFRKKGARLSPYIFGGGQENGLRSGTENTFAIKQFEFAAKKKFSSLKEDFERIRSYNLAVRQGLDKTIFRVLSSENASPYVLSVSARGLRGEVLLHMLDDAGVMVGTGSACSSKNRYSRVILACGLDERSADGVLRISFAATTTLQETEQAIGIINSCAASLAERTK